MIKLVIIAHKKPGMDTDEFRSYWRKVHGPITRNLPGLRKYVQNYALPSADGSAPPCDGFAELWFDDLQSLEKSFASPEGQTAAEDAANFSDVEQTKTFFVEEVNLV